MCIFEDVPNLVKGWPFREEHKEGIQQEGENALLEGCSCTDVTLRMFNLLVCKKTVKNRKVIYRDNYFYRYTEHERGI